MSYIDTGKENDSSIDRKEVRRSFLNPLEDISWMSMTLADEKNSRYLVDETMKDTKHIYQIHTSKIDRIETLPL